MYIQVASTKSSRAALRCFSSPEGDHLTLLNVYRSCAEFLEKSKMLNKEKAEKNLRKWCKENFINSRSLRHARDIHSQIRANVEQMALKQPDGAYRYVHLLHLAAAPWFHGYLCRLTKATSFLCNISKCSHLFPLNLHFFMDLYLYLVFPLNIHHFRPLIGFGKWSDSANSPFFCVISSKTRMHYF
ncbi:hypothetical protein RJ639_010093 [Escallonia herrerae]|uniref:RNA helicase n=1 Tax=Escallonia herrerae TaxID=1293975 RepID=A0AA89ASJ1_9ASTE|nr:hypothetical protein RJ639_010093 [Escallonia herrerae]